MCYLLVLREGFINWEEALCINPIYRKDFNKPFSGKLSFKNKFLKERVPEISDWMELIENTFGIELQEAAWIINKYPRNLLHLAVLLVRQTIETPESYGCTNLEKIKNPLKLRPQVEDPLTKFLYLTDEGVFYESYTHGLKNMVISLKKFQIPFEAVTLKQAIEDLKKTPYGINDCWRAFNVRIGMGIQ